MSSSFGLDGAARKFAVSLKMKRGDFVRNWVPVAIWMIVIFTASTDLMSAEHTSRFIAPFLRWMLPEISAAVILAVQLFVRKLAHLTEYAILAALLLRALRTAANKTGASSALAALAIASVFAASDEFHQSFVPSRTASPVDVLIDIGGAIIGLLVYRAMSQWCSTAFEAESTR